ncbi:hypothetical protein D3C85_1577560 [compost metagenome]
MLPPSALVMVITAWPTFNAVITPVVVTVATVSSLLENVTNCLEANAGVTL